MNQVEIKILMQGASEAGKAMSQLEGDAKKSSEGIGGAFSGISGHIKNVLGDLALFDLAMRGLERLTEPIKGVWDEMNALQSVSAQTAAVLKSTGDASGVTAEQVSHLAEALEGQSTSSKAAIQSMENILLTFTNIGGKILPQTTQAVMDFAAAMHMDLNSAALQVGKALNDPIDGMTKLQREGVSFTQQQKDMVKALVDSGQGMKAQQFILDELAKEFGGSAAAQAKTFSGALTQLKNEAVTGLAEFLNANLLPRLMDFEKVIATQVVPAIKAWLATDLVPKLQQLGEFLQTNVLPALKNFGEFILNTVVPAIHAFWDGQLEPKLSAFVGLLTGTVIPAIKSLADDVLPPVKQALSDIGDFISSHQDLFAAFAAAVGLITAAFVVLGPIVGIVAGLFAALTSPMLLVVVGLAAVGTAVYEVIQHWDEITTKFPAVGEAWDGLRGQIQQFGDWITGTLVPQLQGAWAQIQTDTQGLVTFITTNWDTISTIIGTVMAVIKTIVTTEWNTIKDNIQTIIDLIRGIIAIVTAAIHGDWSGAWAAIKQTAVTVWNDIKNEAGNVLGLIPGVVADIWTAVGDDAGRLWNVIITAVESGVNKVIDLINGMTGAINSAFKSLAGMSIGVPEFDTHIPGVGVVGGGSVNPFSALSGVSIGEIGHVSGGQVPVGGGGGTNYKAPASTSAGGGGGGGQQTPSSGSGPADYSAPDVATDDTGLPDMTGAGAGNFNQGGGGKAKKPKGAGGGTPLSDGQLSQDAADAKKALDEAKAALDALLSPTNADVKRIFPADLIADAVKLQQAMSGGGDTPGLQQAFDAFSAASQKLQSDLQNDPGNKKLIEDDKALVASAKATWEDVSKTVKTARDQQQKDQTTYNSQQQADAAALKTATQDAATAQIQAQTLVTGTVKTKAKEMTDAVLASESAMSAGALSAARDRSAAYLEANQKLIDDITNQVSPTQIAADQTAVESAKNAASDTYNAWHTAQSQLETDLQTLVTNAEAKYNNLGKGLADAFKAMYEQRKAADLDALKQEEDAQLQSLQNQIDAQKTAQDQMTSNVQAQAAYRAQMQHSSDAAIASLQTVVDASSAYQRQKQEQALSDQMVLGKPGDIQGLQLQLAAMQAEDKMKVLKESSSSSGLTTAVDATSTAEKAKTEAVTKQLQVQMEATKKHYEGIQKVIEANYASLLSAQSLQNKALEVLQSGNMDAIISMLKTYNPDWNQTGLDYGKALVEGVKASGIETTVTNILGLLTQATAAAHQLASYSAPTGGSAGATGGLAGNFALPDASGRIPVGGGAGATTQVNISINAIDGPSVQAAMPTITRQLDLYLKRTGGAGLTGTGAAR